MMSLLIKLGSVFLMSVLWLASSLQLQFQILVRQLQESELQISVLYQDIAQPEETDLSEVTEFRSAVNWSGREQLLLELINRARSDPAAEAKRYGIDLNADLDENTISTAPQQPLAPNQLLTNAARKHSQDMLAQDYFSHESPEGSLPATRATEAGYVWNYVGENIAWGGSTGKLNKNAQVSEQHKGLVLSAGHRKNLFKAEYREIGISFQFGRYKHLDERTYNACMLTELFGANLRTGHFITGVVFTDASNGSARDDDFYSLGEGINGGQVVAVNRETQAEYTGEINQAGGYAVQVPPGIYNVSVYGGGLGDSRFLVEGVSVSQANVKIDFETTTAQPSREATR